MIQIQFLKPAFSFIVFWPVCITENKIVKEGVRRQLVNSMGNRWLNRTTTLSYSRPVMCVATCLADLMEKAEHLELRTQAKIRGVYYYW